MSGLKKAARKIGKIGGKVIGTAMGFMVGGPVGAAVGYKAGDMAGDAIVKTADKGLGAPKSVEPAPLAMPDEEEIRRAQRRSVAARAGRSGRASTILTGDRETLG